MIDLQIFIRDVSGSLHMNFLKFFFAAQVNYPGVWTFTVLVKFPDTDRLKLHKITSLKMQKQIIRNVYDNLFLHYIMQFSVFRTLGSHLRFVAIRSACICAVLRTCILAAVFCIVLRICICAILRTCICAVLRICILTVAFV